MAPGSIEGLQLVTSDMAAARGELVERGVDVSEVEDLGRPGGPTLQARPLQGSRRQHLGAAGAPVMSLVTGVDFAVVLVKDFDGAVAFYGDVLGLPESTRYGKMPGVEFETGNLTLAILEAAAFGLEFKPSGHPIGAARRRRPRRARPARVARRRVPGRHRRLARSSVAASSVASLDRRRRRRAPRARRRRRSTPGTSSATPPAVAGPRPARAPRRRREHLADRPRVVHHHGSGEQRRMAHDPLGGPDELHRAARVDREVAGAELVRHAADAAVDPQRPQRALPAARPDDAKRSCMPAIGSASPSTSSIPRQPSW